MAKKLTATHGEYTIAIDETGAREAILGIMKLIAEDIKKESTEDTFKYNQQRNMINRVFQNNSQYDIGTIMLRLTVIDSLYSTNAAYSYFSIEEMAKKIKELGEESDAANYFYSIVKEKKDEKPIKRGNIYQTNGLFQELYGIRKNLDNGSKQASLMSKYAYYQLLQNKNEYPLGFPIYDSLAIKTFPKICNKLSDPELSKWKLKIPAEPDSECDICNYIQGLNELREILFGKNDSLFEGLQQFDILDAYLWRMGKIEEGNMSLLLDRNDYERFVKNIGLDKQEPLALYKKYKDKKYNNKELVLKRANKKPNSETYTYNFNKLVQYEINNKLTTELVKGLSQVNYVSALIEHWRVL